MKVRPLGENVLVQPVDVGETTHGSIVIPDTAAEKPQQGIVKAVGKGVLSDKNQRRTMHVKVGDNVIYASYSGTAVTIDGEEYLILRESEILAVF